MKTAKHNEPTLNTGVKGTARVAALASVILIVLIAVWVTVTTISGAVIAQGQAVVRGKPKIVQSLNGGVVESLFVKDGDVVKAGDILLRFDPTLLHVNLDIYRTRFAEVIAREARLEAEYLGLPKISFPATPEGLDPAVLARHFAGQNEIFDARREVLAGSKEQLKERILQFRNQITGVEGRTAATKDQLEYVERELESMRALQAKELARESQVLELQGKRSSLLGALSEIQADYARIHNSIRDTELEVLQTERQFREDVVTELREATATREELVLQIVTVQKELERIDVVAPVNGVIHEMQVFTIGGVVPPQGTILEVVPTDGGVEFELQVDPLSINSVFVGQSARVVFPNFDPRTAPNIFGTVSGISPTSIVNQLSGRPYYRLNLIVPTEELALLGDVVLIPGMPIEAFLQTGERSVLSYLTKPLTDQLLRAFREG